MSAQLIGKSVEEIRRCLGDGFAFEMVERVEDHLGVDVWVLDMEGPAYSMTVVERTVIVVKRSPSWFRQNFSLAHEVGHLVSSPLSAGTAPSDAQSEREANAFAAELLMPRDDLEVVDWWHSTPEQIAELVWNLGVSTEALRNRLEKLGIQPASEIRDLLAEKTWTLLRRHWRRRNDQGDPITNRRDQSLRRRVPPEFSMQLEEAVLGGRAPVESLAFVLDVPAAEIVHDVDTPSDEEMDDIDRLFG